MVAVVPLPEILTAPLVHARARRPSGAVTAFHQDAGPQATNAAVPGMGGGGAAAPGVTQCGLVVPVPVPHHGCVLVLVHALLRIRHTRDIVEAGRAPGPSVVGEEVIAGKISEIVGLGLRHSVINFLVSTKYNCMQKYIWVLVSISLCSELRAHPDSVTCY